MEAGSEYTTMTDRNRWMFEKITMLQELVKTKELEIVQLMVTIEELNDYIARDARDRMAECSPAKLTQA